MTITDWLNSPWPYLYVIGITVALSLNWMWDRTQQDRAESKERHPSSSRRQPPTGLAAYDPANGEWFDG